MNFIETLIPKTIKLEIDDIEYEVLNFGDYLKLEYYKKSLFDSIKSNKHDDFIDITKKIIELQIKRKIEINDPIIVIKSLFDVIINNKINADVKFIVPPPQKDDKKPIEKSRIDYSGRYFAELINLMVSKYHWTWDYIQNLNLDFVMYLLQEIMVDNHNDREWQYGLTEMAYSYDSNTKKSKYRPLKKPYWMDDNIEGEIPKTKILKSMLPMGVVNKSGIVDDISRYIESQQDKSKIIQ